VNDIIEIVVIVMEVLLYLK